jgi:UPF0755 protein
MMGSFRKRLLLMLSGLVAAGAIAAGAGYWFVMDVRNQSLALTGEPQRVILARGETLATLASELGERGIVRDPLRLQAYGRISGRANRLQAGEYRLTPGMDVDAMLTAMETGEVVEYRLTVVEGWRFSEMLEAIREHDAVETRLADAQPALIMDRIGADGDEPEGRFLPQTYHFPRGTTDEALLRRAHRAMEEVLADAWAERQEGLPLDSPYEALILASIIEKETSLAAERRRIAGVFVRRLKRGMRLQTDPTVIYGMGESYDGNIRREDLRRDTPYNTYTRHGLPPTPIALPGEAAVRAAVDPAEGDALYFVAKQGGGHKFSETLEEHNRAVRRHQLGQ